MTDCVVETPDAGHQEDHPQHQKADGRPPVPPPVRGSNLAFALQARGPWSRLEVGDAEALHLDLGVRSAAPAPATGSPRRRVTK